MSKTPPRHLIEFEDDGASFRVRREREVNARYSTVIDQRPKGGRFVRWWKKSSPAKIYATLVLWGIVLVVLYIVLSIAFLIALDAIEGHPRP